MHTLRRVFRPGCTNVILNYGPLDFDNVLALRWSRRLGYKVVFYIVEDYDLAWGISRSLSHRLKMAGITRLQHGIRDIASGVVVITSHLREKYEKMTNGKVPIHYSPIAIDFDRFPDSPGRFNKDVTLFYSGSFGSKDGLPVLLDAFDKLATKNDNVRLVLTGKGGDEVMRQSFLGSMRRPVRIRSTTTDILTMTHTMRL